MKPYKVNMKLSDFEGEPDNKEFLEIFDKKINANKFYRVYIFDTIVLRHWGRHGSKGQTLAEECGAAYAARDYSWRLVAKKMSKGYKKEATMMDRLVREFDDEDFDDIT